MSGTRNGHLKQRSTVNWNLAPHDAVMALCGLSANAIQGATMAILPGDPGRVELIARGIGDRSSFLTSRREYTSWLTHVGDTPVLVCSTGMGGPSVAMGVEELARIGIKTFIRVGTSGAIQPEIEPGDLVITSAAVRLEGTSAHYAPVEYPAVASYRVLRALDDAAAMEKIRYHLGITATSDTYWPGQERYDSFTGYVLPKFRDSLNMWKQLGVLNFEMEAATLLTVANTFGLEAGAVCAILVQRNKTEAPSKEAYDKGMKNMMGVVRHTVLNLLA